MNSSRVENSITNAKTSLFFYVLSLFGTFLSRGIFIKDLGSEFVGLTSTMINIVGFFNLAEMGLASVIAFALYTPLHEKEENTVIEILSLLQYFYKKIGSFIIIIGSILSLFILDFFKESGFSNYTILTTYFIYLVTSVLGYFVNYKEILLVADQKSHIKNKLTNGLKLIKIFVQLVTLLYLSKSIYVWLCIEFNFLIIYYFILNKKIRELYPNYNIKILNNSILIQKYKFIYTKTKQAFYHKACGIFLIQSSGILIYWFSNLDTVTKYTNYTLITSSVLTLVSSIFDSTNASVGNLIAEKNNPKILRVFWELQVARYWIACSISYITYSIIDIFISIWLGTDFIIEENIKCSLIIILFIMIIRKTNDEFIAAYGLYKDIWAPIAEAVINLVIAISFGYLIGIASIPLGMAVSLLLFVVIWKPIFLYKEKMHQNLRLYLCRISKYLLIALFSLFIVHNIPLYNFTFDNKYFYLFVFLIQESLLTILVTLFFYFISSSEMRSFVKRFI